jgi:nucleoside-diphosphate-sugar epimerase
VNILVTGASGFIGSTLCEELVQSGHQVRALDLTAPPSVLDGRVEHLQGDITDRGVCARAVHGCEAVCHLAARVGDWGPARAYFEVNVGGTQALLGAARAEGLRRFVLVSSLAVHHYGGHLDGDERTARDATINAYARSKIAAEDLLREEAGPVEWCIVRPGVFPFGPRDRTSFVHLAAAAEKGGLGFVNGGQALVTTAYVENLVEGLRLALEHPRAADQTFVMGDPQPVSWRELFERLAGALDAPRPRLNVPELLAYPLASAMELGYHSLRIQRPPPLTRYRILLAARDCHFVSHKARDLLGYQPRVGLDEALARSVAWYRREVRPHPTEAP